MAHPDDITILDAQRVSRTVHSPAGWGQAAAADSKSVTWSTENEAVMSGIAAQPAGVTKEFTVNPTCYVGELDKNTIVFLPTVISVARQVDKGFWLNSLMVSDISNNKPPMSLLFFNDAVDIGTLGGAMTMSTADRMKCIGEVLVSAADYKQRGTNFWQAYYSGLQMGFMPKSGTQNIWVAGVQLQIDNLTYAAASISLLGSGTQD